MNTTSLSTLNRVATVVTVVIAVAFIVFGLVIQQWMVVGVFVVIGMAALSMWPVVSRTR